MRYYYIKKLVAFLGILLIASATVAQTTDEIEYFDLQDVELLDSLYIRTADFNIPDSVRTGEKEPPGIPYIDSYERLLYNYILADSVTDHPAGLAEMIYSRQGNSLYVNLFVSSRVDWKKKNIELVQESNFPGEASATLIVGTKKPVIFTINLRYPAWVEEGMMKVTVNGKPFAVKNTPGEYVPIRRKWRKGDKIEVELPMKHTAEPVPDKPNHYFFLCGPVMLAAEATTADGIIPPDDVPIVVSDADKIASLLTPVPDKPMAFTLSNLYSDKYPDKMELLPLYRLSGSPYIIYWPQANVQELKEIHEKIKRGDKERIALENKTIDSVMCGEQQSETDHRAEGSNSRAGFIEDIYWREAGGWFSYRLENREHNARFLYVSWLDTADMLRYCDVYINWQKAGTVQPAGNNGNNRQAVVFKIPHEESLKDTLLINFVAHPNSVTPKIVEVRLLTE